MVIDKPGKQRAKNSGKNDNPCFHQNKRYTISEDKATPPKAIVPNFPPKPLKTFFAEINNAPVKKALKIIKVYPEDTAGAVIPTKAPQYAATGTLWIHVFLKILGRYEASVPVKPAAITLPNSRSTLIK